MVSNNSAETSQQTASSDAKAGAVGVPVLNPGSPIEAAAPPPGTVNDPPVPDTRPPGACDDSEFSAYV